MCFRKRELGPPLPEKFQIWVGEPSGSLNRGA